MPLSNDFSYSYTRGAIGQVDIPAQSTRVLAPNNERRSAIICNNGSFDIYLAIGIPAVFGQGIFLRANGGTYEINSTNLTHAAVYGIVDSSTGSVSIHEGT